MRDFGKMREGSGSLSPESHPQENEEPMFSWAAAETRSQAPTIRDC